MEVAVNLTDELLKLSSSHAGMIEYLEQGFAFSLLGDLDQFILEASKSVEITSLLKVIGKDLFIWTEWSYFAVPTVADVAFDHPTIIIQIIFIIIII